jgi:hypothetical protein
MWIYFVSVSFYAPVCNLLKKRKVADFHIVGQEVQDARSHPEPTLSLIYFH